jgi:TIR domain
VTIGKLSEPGTLPLSPSVILGGVNPREVTNELPESGSFAITYSRLEQPAERSPVHRDIFVSHASEDKNSVARPLTKALRRAGLTIWFDEAELTVGDSLRRKIDEALKNSRFGVVVLSPHFFSKEWPQRELDGLIALEKNSKKILPVWHKVTADQVREYSPILADRLAINTAKGIRRVAKAIIRAVKQKML